MKALQKEPLIRKHQKVGPWQRHVFGDAEVLQLPDEVPGRRVRGSL